MIYSHIFPLRCLLCRAYTRLASDNQVTLVLDFKKPEEQAEICVRVLHLKNTFYWSTILTYDDNSTYYKTPRHSSYS